MTNTWRDVESTAEQMAEAEQGEGQWAEQSELILGLKLPVA